MIVSLLLAAAVAVTNAPALTLPAPKLRTASSWKIVRDVNGAPAFSHGGAVESPFFFWQRKLLDEEAGLFASNGVHRYSIRLPRTAARITDVTKERVLAESADAVTLDLKQYETAVLFIE